ncbi:MAG: arsenite methyltransferase [Armatimonadetes bacterium]|nr:arsenite methyltransferase [Armatimonadota bacterium]
MSTDAETIKSAVRETYGRVARGGGSCCGGGGDVVQSAAAMGYDLDDADAFAEVANLGLGCGAPLTFAAVQAGETVLDLGSGAGFDAFLARREAGEKGRVIGVDMTPEMLERARFNAAKLGYTNVEFRAGEIETMPVEDASVDLVISNCVLNLVPDKAVAFAQIARVLKPGGRMVVSDIVQTDALPAELRHSLAAHAACVSGAVPLATYLALLEAAGLERIEVLREVDAKPLLTSTACCDEATAALGEGMLASVTVRAWKPRQGCCHGCC